MTLKTIAEVLGAKVLLDTGNLDAEVMWAYSADLMSDVLYFCLPKSVLLTGLARSVVIQTAELSGIKGIIFIQNKTPDNATVELARQKNISLFVTPHCMYVASGKLFHAGLPGCPKG